MYDFIIASAVSVTLIALSIFIFYECLHFAWSRKARFENKPRRLIYHLVLAIFIAHTLCVWLYGAAYWMMIDVLSIGSLEHTSGHAAITGDVFSFERLLAYVYFSVTCYSSLGFGDLTPGGVIRMVAGIEALNGLLLIGWSVTYTYFAAERFLSHERSERKLRK